MKADIGDPSAFVKENSLPEITTTNLFNRAAGIPDPEGLVSYDIFGNPGSSKRKKQFAYINLGDTFVHPMALDCMKQLKKALKDVVYGIGTYYVKDGELIKVGKTPTPDGADIGTGTNWLKKHFREINFSKEKMSNTVKERVDFLRLLKDEEIFCDKWLVIPPYYRDVDIVSSKKNELNQMYQILISQAKVVKTTKSMFGEGEVTQSHKKIQDQLTAIYLYFTGTIAGTKAFMQKHVLGKGITYAARMVISTAKINAPSTDLMEVDYAHSAVPLSAVIECFAPFIHYGFRQVVQQLLAGSEFITVLRGGKKERIRLSNSWEEILLNDSIQALIKLYTDSKEHRLDYLTVELEDGTRAPLMYMSVTPDTQDFQYGKLEDFTEQNVHPITLCELFYIIAMNTVKDKSVAITRYPVEDYQNIYPSLMNIMPYERTIKARVNGIEYPRFPLIRDEDFTNPNIGEMFNDTLHMFPTYLPSLGADFDGDTVTVEGIFSKGDPEKYIYSNTNIINMAGHTMRGISDANSQAIYALTRDAEYKR